MNERKPYPSDLTDPEWQEIDPLLPVQVTGRRRLYSQRELLDGVLYVARTGCSWRMLPHDLPPWESVYAYFRKLERLGLWQQINDHLRERVRLQAGREAHPSTIVADSQSVKTAEKGGHVASMVASGSKGASGKSQWIRWVC